MRTIKFRAQRVDNATWVYGNLMQISKDNKNSFDKVEFTTGIQMFENGIFKAVFEVNPETVSPFTSWEDKNGKIIFGDDIIQYFSKKLLVEISLDNGISLLVLNKPFCDNFQYDSRSIITDTENIEVIGNIHDSPELFSHPFPLPTNK